MPRYPLRVYAAALVFAALGYASARVIRGPHVGWGGPALIAFLTFAEWDRKRRASPPAAGESTAG